MDKKLRLFYGSDMGAQLPSISKIDEILDLYDELRVQLRNQTQIPFAGWVGIKFELTGPGNEVSQQLHILFFGYRRSFKNNFKVSVLLK